jgi:hypothetical protein
MRLAPINNPESKKVKIQIYIPPNYHNHIAKESSKYGITISELVRSIIRKHYGTEIEATNGSN